MTVPASPLPLRKASSLPRPPASSAPIPGDLRGRVTEVSARGWHGTLSFLCDLIGAAQHRGEVTAWLRLDKTVFYPPDVAARGIDLGGLVVVSVPGLAPALQAAEVLVRSRAFGLVVLDGVAGPLGEADLARLARLAEDRGTAVVLTTRKAPEAPSLGVGVSLRLAVEPAPEGASDLVVLRDKRGGPGGRRRMRRRGPAGLY